MLVDSHCHLDHLNLEDREGGLEALLAETRECGVSHILTVAVDLPSSKGLIELTRQHRNIYSTVGCHPLQKTPIPVPEVDVLVELAAAPNVVAIGETGLDNFYSRETADWQRESFINHLTASSEAKKPLVIHTREARKETIDLLRQFRSDAGGVMHCFTEDWDMAKKALDLGFYISFSGIVTFRNAEALRGVAKKVPMDRLLVETDAPWLAPVPFRGKQNEPKYVKYVAECIADLKQSSLEAVSQATSENFSRLFHIDL